MNKNVIAIYRNETMGYSSEPPFCPNSKYPEYPFTDISIESNKVYEGIRNLLKLIGDDKENYGTSYWNPLGKIINSGDKVALKPNFVKEAHLRKKNEGDYIITNDSIIKMALDYVIMALKNSGGGYIVDAPQTDSDFDKIIERVKLKEIVDSYEGKTDIKIDYYDLRLERWHPKDGIIVSRKKLPSGKKGYVEVNLRKDSGFYGKKN